MTTTAPPSTALEFEPLTIADRTFRSLLILGTSKYKDGAERNAALEALGTEMATGHRIVGRKARVARLPGLQQLDPLVVGETCRRRSRLEGLKRGPRLLDRKTSRVKQLFDTETAHLGLLRET